MRMKPEKGTPKGLTSQTLYLPSAAAEHLDPGFLPQLLLVRGEEVTRVTICKLFVYFVHYLDRHLFLALMQHYFPGR